MLQSHRMVAVATHSQATFKCMVITQDEASWAAWVQDESSVTAQMEGNQGCIAQTGRPYTLET